MTVVVDLGLRIEVPPFGLCIPFSLALSWLPRDPKQSLSSPETKDCKRFARDEKSGPVIIDRLRLLYSAARQETAMFSATPKMKIDGDPHLAPAGRRVQSGHHLGSGQERGLKDICSGFWSSRVELLGLSFLWTFSLAGRAGSSVFGSLEEVVSSTGLLDPL